MAFAYLHHLQTRLDLQRNKPLRLTQAQFSEDLDTLLGCAATLSASLPAPQTGGPGCACWERAFLGGMARRIQDVIQTYS